MMKCAILCIDNNVEDDDDDGDVVRVIDRLCGAVLVGSFEREKRF